jgi:mannose-1-phosphate guanylyltransferase
MLHAVIMAGGAGTRFWPESRAKTPKQLLRLYGERTMIQATVDRLAGLVPPERLLIVANARLVEPIAQQLPELSRANLVGEPCKRDTAPCIGLAALLALRTDPDATLAVMPSDHVIQPAEVFRKAIEQAARLVEQAPQRIVTFGIRPTYPAEIFGYIERGEPLASSGELAFPSFTVRRFREKPKAETAAEYLASGNFSWNSGIFVWTAATILAALEARQPELVAHLHAIDAAWNTPALPEVFEREFAAIRGVSIDYAVMEHATDVAVIEAPFAWDDVGSWQAMARLRGADAQGNTVVGKHLGLRTSGTVVHGPAEHLIVTVGLEDCLIVHTPDATLVANKHDEEAIREVVKLLAERGWEEYL